jgi:hypothetical protein
MFWLALSNRLEFLMYESFFIIIIIVLASLHCSSTLTAWKPVWPGWILLKEPLEESHAFPQAMIDGCNLCRILQHAQFRLSQ